MKTLKDIATNTIIIKKLGTKAIFWA